MGSKTEVTTLFVDVGGVLLTDRGDRHARRRAADYFALDYSEMEERHKLTFEVHEDNRLTFNEYLDLVSFWRKRTFTPAQCKQFMLDQSQPYPEMIEFFSQLKAYRIADASRATVRVITTDEELMIAKTVNHFLTVEPQREN